MVQLKVADIGLPTLCVQLLGSSLCSHSSARGSAADGVVVLVAAAEVHCALVKASHGSGVRGANNEWVERGAAAVAVVSSGRAMEVDAGGADGRVRRAGAMVGKRKR